MIASWTLLLYDCIRARGLYCNHHCSVDPESWDYELAGRDDGARIFFDIGSSCDIGSSWEHQTSLLSQTHSESQNWRCYSQLCHTGFETLARKSKRDRPCEDNLSNDEALVRGLVGVRGVCVCVRGGGHDNLSLDSLITPQSKYTLRYFAFIQNFQGSPVDSAKRMHGVQKHIFADNSKISGKHSKDFGVAVGARVPSEPMERIPNFSGRVKGPFTNSVTSDADTFQHKITPTPIHSFVTLIFYRFQCISSERHARNPAGIYLPPPVTRDAIHERPQI